VQLAALRRGRGRWGTLATLRGDRDARPGLGMTATAPIDSFFEATDCPGCSATETAAAPPVIADTDLYGEAEEPYASMRFQYLRCTRCDTVYLQRRIRQDELAYFYNHEYHC
jgi:hypothetical protein